MNLYWVEDDGAEWGAYVFADTRGKAKSAFMKEFERGWYNDMEYENLRANIRAKDVGNKLKSITTANAYVVDDTANPAYELVKSLGYEYMTEEEAEEADK